MQTYVLLLLGILVVLLVGVIYFGWKKIINLEIENNKNKYDIEALRGLLSKILSDDTSVEQIQNAQAQAQAQAQAFAEAQMQAQMQANAQMQEQNPPVVESGGRMSEEMNLPVREEESDVDTLESTNDNMPDDLESTVSVESIHSSSSEEESEAEVESDAEVEVESGAESESDDDDDEEAQAMIEKELELEETEEVKEVDGKEEGDEPEQEVEQDNKSVDLDEYNKKLEEMVTKTSDIKRGKRLPNESAKSFKIGYKMKSQNDGKMYEVAGRGNGRKWKLVE